jgi:lipoprotein signal peptidase
MKSKFYWFSFVLLVGIDQVSKWWLGQNGDGVVVINSSLAGGLGEVQAGVLLGVWVGLLGLYIKKKVTSPFMVLILAGGLSNIIDRFVWGGVQDWLPLPMTDLTNNLADWMIGIGILGLVVEMWGKKVHFRKFKPINQ